MAGRGWQMAQRELPRNSSVSAARRAYDADAGSGVADTPLDPGAGILALANEVSGHGANELGPVDTVSVTAPDVDGAVRMRPLRDNPMGYYLRETPDAMRFTADQASVMRRTIIEGGAQAASRGPAGRHRNSRPAGLCGMESQHAGQRLTWHHDLPAHRAEHNRMRRQGFALTQQQAYTRNGSVFYDGIWGPGTQPQEILWGWRDEHVFSDVTQRATRNMVPLKVQGYQHLDHGPRYNVIYEPGTGNSRVLLGVTQDQLTQRWAALSPQGYRLTCLSSHVDAAGAIRHSTVLRKTATPQRWVTGWTGEDIAAEYGRQWDRGWRSATSRSSRSMKVFDGRPCSSRTTRGSLFIGRTYASGYLRYMTNSGPAITSFGRCMWPSCSSPSAGNNSAEAWPNPPGDRETTTIKLLGRIHEQRVRRRQPDQDRIPVF